MKINGTLVFDASSASEIQNLRVQKVTSLPTFLPGSDPGRLVYNTTNNTLYKGGTAAWEALATGGSAFSQTEGDAIETTLGALINSDGTQNISALTFAGAATDLTTALNALAATVVGHELLSELGDVALSSATPSAGKFLMFNGTNAVDHTLVLADVSDVTSSAAEVNALHGQGAVAADFAKLHAITTSAAQINNATATTATTTELNYVSGVTSAIQTQLNGKQALNAGLTAMSTLLDGAGTGILVQTGVDTVTERTIASTAADVVITNGSGVLGNPSISLAGNTGSLAALATPGFVVMTAAGSITARDITGTAGRTVVTNGDGVASDANIDLATVSNAGGGAFLKLATDAYGRVTGTSAVVASDVTSLVDSTYVNVTGDTMTGSLTMSGGATVTGLPTPVAASDATPKSYVDAAVTGLTWKNSAKAIAIASVSITAAPASIDGYTLVAGDRVVLTAQTPATDDGIYVFAAAGAAMTRAADAATYQELSGAAVFITEGTVYKDSGWVQGNDLTSFAGQSWTEFSGGSTYVGGVGISIAGNVISAQLGAGITQLPTGDIGVSLYNAAGGNLALILTTDGTTHSTAPGSELFLLLDTGSGLTQTSTGLKISAAGVTNAMLQNPAITLNADSGTGSAALGSTLLIEGNSAQGVVTSLPSAETFQVSVNDATTTTKGVSKFDAASFTVASGAVSISAGGVSNTQLANSSFGVSGTTGGTQQIALGGTLSIVGGSSPITTVSAVGSVTINVASATTSTLGLASFNASQFSVTSGAVSVAMTLGQGGLTNVNSTVDAAATNDVLQFNGTKWTNATPASILGDASIHNLGDVTVTSVAEGQTLVNNGSGQFVNKSIFYTNTYTAATSWTVSHNLGQQFVNVTVMVNNGDGTYDVVIPQSITMNTANTVTVTFNTAVAGAVAVMGIA